MACIFSTGFWHLYDATGLIVSLSAMSHSDVRTAGWPSRSASVITALEKFIIFLSIYVVIKASLCLNTA
jgi:hypothetical protein